MVETLVEDRYVDFKNGCSAWVRLDRGNFKIYNVWMNEPSWSLIQLEFQASTLFQCYTELPRAAMYACISLFNCKELVLW